MDTLDNIKNVYFIGIGGIGMSALARYFHASGKWVAGYDKTVSPITKGLEVLGISVVYNDDIENIPHHFKSKENTLVVYTPAVPAAHRGLQYFKFNGFEVQKRSVVLGGLTKDKYCLAIAGTHGKTTTSSILGHLLAESGVPVTAFLGGIAENYASNLIQKGGDVIVVEADEYDRSFLQLYPDIACITSIDADHLDIYGDEAQFVEGFMAFGKQVKENGKLFVTNGLPFEAATVGIEDNAQYSAQNIRIADGAYHFDFKHPQGVLEDLLINLPGRHNLTNAVTAMAMAVEYGAPHDRLANALASFKGVNRRFSYRVKKDDLVLIDDYAHHPTEIDAVHQSIREMYPGDKVLAVFQPHLFSRTRDFMGEFAKSLSRFDELILLDIYPAREEPIEGINAKSLLNLVSIPFKRICTKDELVHAMKSSKPSWTP